MTKGQDIKVLIESISNIEKGIMQNIMYYVGILLLQGDGLNVAQELIRYAGAHCYTSTIAHQFKIHSFDLLEKLFNKSTDHIDPDIERLLSELRGYILSALTIDKDVAVKSFKLLTPIVDELIKNK